MEEIKQTWQPKILAFLCNWCSYAGADLAGVSRFQYPPSVKIVRIPCSGRINPQFVLKGFQQGADAILVSGCHPGECHYTSGNLHARRKFILLKNFLEYVGIEKGRLHFSWVSASEGIKFAKLIKQIDEEVRNLGPMKKLVKNILIQ